MPSLLDLEPIRDKGDTPLYVAVRDHVRAAIDGGSVGPGEQLPSTKALSEHLSVSLVTVHRALQELVAVGVLRRGQGRGTFVHEDYLNGDRKASDTRFGVVFHAEASLADPYHSQVFEGIRQASEESGVDLVLLRYGEDWRRECIGFIYVNPFEGQFSHAPQFGANQGSRRPPVMAIGANFDRPGVCTVDTDNVALSRDAVEHLLDLGHRRLLFLGGSNRSSNAMDREAGFEQAVKDAGLDAGATSRLANGDWRLDERGKAMLRERLGRREGPTGVVAAGYYFALDVYSAAREMGLSIPEDISVIGVDDPPSAEHLSPSLTTFRQPLIELGRRGVNELLACLADRAGTRVRLTLPAELIVRASTARPRV